MGEGESESSRQKGRHAHAPDKGAKRPKVLMCIGLLVKEGRKKKNSEV